MKNELLTIFVSICLCSSLSLPFFHSLCLHFPVFLLPSTRSLSPNLDFVPIDQEGVWRSIPLIIAIDFSPLTQLLKWKRSSSGERKRSTNTLVSMFRCTKRALHKNICGESYNNQVFNLHCVIVLLDRLFPPFININTLQSIHWSIRRIQSYIIWFLCLVFVVVVVVVVLVVGVPSDQWVFVCLCVWIEDLYESFDMLKCLWKMERD